MRPRRHAPAGALLLAASLLAPAASAQFTLFQSQNPQGVNNHIQHTAVWFDYDGDGLLDLLLTTESGTSGQGGYPRSNRLYHTSINGQGQPVFADVSQATGIENTNHASNGAVAADVDNDGDMDLFIANQLHQSFPNPPQNFLYLYDDTTGTFSDVAEQAGVLGGDHNMSVAAVDYDLDGWVDLFCGQVVQGSVTFVPNFLYRNLGTPGPGQLPAFQQASAPALSQPTEATYQAAWADYDLDGYPDVLLCQTRRGSGTDDKDVLAHNDTGTGFTDVTAGSGLNDVVLNGFAAWGDYDDDGDFDVYVTNWTDFGIGSVNPYGQLYRNEYPSPTFTNVTSSVNLENPFYADSDQFTPAWIDFDNDGDLDLWSATGLNHGNLVFQNRLVETGSATFLDKSLLSGAYDIMSQMSSAVADVDDNGWLDVLSTKEQFGLIWEGPRLHLSVTDLVYPNNHWLRLRLDGSISARSGRDTRVETTLSSGVSPSRWSGDQASTFSGGERIVHLGLGTDPQVPPVALSWPSGIHQTLWDLAADGPVRDVVEQGLRVQGTAVPGGSVTFDIAGAAGDLYLFFLGLGTVAPVPLPPYQGRLELDLALPLFLLQAGNIPSTRFDSFVLAIPNNPSLQGLSLFFQSLQGPFPPASSMAWWDALTLTIQ